MRFRNKREKQFGKKPERKKDTHKNQSIHLGKEETQMQKMLIVAESS